MTRKRVATLGAGSWGTALADVLGRNGHDVALWARNPEHAREIGTSRVNGRYLPGVELSQSIRATSDLEEALDCADFVITACPAQALRGVLEQAAPTLGGATLVSTSKGIEVGTGCRMSEVVVDVLGDGISREIVVLSGPSFAGELVRGLPTAVVAASRSDERALAVQRLFQNAYLRVYTQHDVDGVELGGALKNIIAIAAGVSDGLQLGSNARAALINRGLAEIGRLARRLGAKESTVGGLAGLGDLVLTCTGQLSRNRSAGLAIGSGTAPDEVLGRPGQVVEGAQTVKAARDLAGSLGVEMPITISVYSILYEGVAPREALALLMAREPKPERWD